MLKYLKFGERESRGMEAVYLTPDVVATRCRVIKLLAPRQGERILDIGSGMGLTTRDMALAVGSAARVCGVDTSKSMLSIATVRCADIPWVEFRQADATKVPYAARTFDGGVSTQVYNYVRRFAGRAC